MNDDLCAECDAPIPGRPEFKSPGERERFCGNCASWRRRNLIPFPKAIEETTGTPVRDATREFCRRNCAESVPANPK